MQRQINAGNNFYNQSKAGAYNISELLIALKLNVSRVCSQKKNLSDFNRIEWKTTRRTTTRITSLLSSTKLTTTVKTTFKPKGATMSTFNRNTTSTMTTRALRSSTILKGIMQTKASTKITTNRLTVTSKSVRTILSTASRAKTTTSAKFKWNSKGK
jgi:hypothetical protein